MIASLHGTILKRDMNSVVIDVGGVGYQVAISLNTLERLPSEGDVFLHVATIVRENSLELYGFHDQQEKRIFELLISVSGIGPRTSLTILSGISPESFCDAVIIGDTERLTRIPGIGKKSAERLVVELRDKVLKLGLSGGGEPQFRPEETLEQDVASSLVALGYKDREAARVAKKVLKNASPEITPAEAVRLALKELMKP
jgi:Holliday junction DNA helicase RuvA|uniref:Holliday junction branch migration complex subunit RuvA n=1 Tax=Desulfomonile tiedjei TaxID=2358 RepID=A0A7C4EVW8_9BACT